MIIITHFTNEKSVLSVVILDFIKLQKKHSNENQIAIVLNVFNNFEIRNKLDYMIINNIYFNNFFIDVVAIFLKDENVVYNIYKQRYRCNDYIINLIMQDFLFGQTINNYKFFENEVISSFDA